MRGAVLSRADRLVLLALLIGLAVVPTPAQEQSRSILIGFYMGDLSENPALNEVRIFRQDAYHPLGLLKKRMIEAGEGLSSSYIDAVLDATGLKKVAIMGLYDNRWPDKKGKYEYSITPGNLGWLFSCVPKVISPEELRLQLKISMLSGLPVLEGENKEERYKAITRDFQQKPDQEVNQEVSSGFQDPILISVPFRDKVLISLIAWTNSSADASSRPTPFVRDASADPKKTAIVTAPQILLQVAPRYPDELRQIRGEVVLLVAIDPSGAVQSARIIKSLHPYLDYCASNALLQWKFAPVKANGKPVPATFSLTYDFDPDRNESDRTPPNADIGPSPEVRVLLARGLASSNALVTAAPFFLCQEMIREKHRYMAPAEKPDLWVDRYSEIIRSPFSNSNVSASGWSVYRVNFSERMERTTSINEYQILGKEEKIRERRVTIEKDGLKTGNSSELADDKRLSSLNPFLLARKLLGNDNRPQFFYRLIDRERIMRREAEVIEAIPLDKNSSFIESAKIWLEKDKGTVLKIEIGGIPFEGYDDVWREAAAFGFQPKSNIEILFGIENKGFLYPSRTTVSIQYRLPDPIGLLDKIALDVTYKNHKFFSVETDHRLR